MPWLLCNCILYNCNIYIGYCITHIVNSHGWYGSCTGLKFTVYRTGHTSSRCQMDSLKTSMALKSRMIQLTLQNLITAIIIKKSGKSIKWPQTGRTHGVIMQVRYKYNENEVSSWLILITIFRTALHFNFYRQTGLTRSPRPCATETASYF